MSESQTTRPDTDLRAEWERLRSEWLDAYLACESLHGAHGTGDAFVAARAALDAFILPLLADRMRLDWLEATAPKLCPPDNMPYTDWMVGLGVGATIRAAIDAGRGADTTEGGSNG